MLICNMFDQIKTLAAQGPFSMESELPLPWDSDLVYLVNIYCSTH